MHKQFKSCKCALRENRLSYSQRAETLKNKYKLSSYDLLIYNASLGLSLGGVLQYRGNGEGVDLEKRRGIGEMGGVEEGRTVVGMSCIRRFYLKTK